MSLQALTKVLEQDDLPSAAKFVLLILANYANEDGESYPSIGNIAKKTSLSVRTVRTQLSLLIERGLIRRIPRFIDGQQRSNVFILLLGGVNDVHPRVNELQGGGADFAPPGVQISHPDTKELDTKEDTKEINTYKPEPKKPAVERKTAKPATVKKTPTTIPDDFQITDAMRAWADQAVPTLDIDFELPRFIDRCLSKGTTYVDWIAGWRTQMKNAVEWGQGKTKTATATKQVRTSPIDSQEPSPRLDYEWAMMAQASHPTIPFNDREMYEKAKASWIAAYIAKGELEADLLAEIAAYESSIEFERRFSKTV